MTQSILFLHLPKARQMEPQTPLQSQDLYMWSCYGSGYGRDIYKPPAPVGHAITRGNHLVHPVAYLCHICQVSL